MNAPDRCESDGEPLEHRQPLSVAGHHQFRESIAEPDRDYDAVDLALDEDDDDDLDPLLFDRPPGRRSAGELARLDAIFDELERRAK